MSFQFKDPFDQEVYADWHWPLLEALFGQEGDLYHELYDRTHVHRREHNGGSDDGPCNAWPSPPYRAPAWRIIAEAIGATRFLEIGTATGYTTALMASAGGPKCHVDTVEIDDAHTQIAEAELGKLGLLDRVRIIRGDAAGVVPELTTPYDVVFTDGGHESSYDLAGLVRPGGALPSIKSRLQGPLIQVLSALRASTGAKQLSTQAISEARASYRQAVLSALEASWND